jgi:hypothetical protein
MKKIIFTMLAVFSVSLFASEDGEKKFNLGGYGELHLNKTITEDESNPAAVLDFHRFVLMFGYDFTEQWSLNSEIEIEHAFIVGGEKSGEVELEQAYIDFHPNAAININAGIMLPAVGIINEQHEPTTFLSVERPIYSKKIIPTTWFGAGVGAGGVIGGQVKYRAMVIEGLDDRNFREKDGIRAGRQKAYKASLETIVVNAAVDYIGLPGIRVGTSVAVNQLTSSGKDLVEDEHPYTNTTLWEVHTSVNKFGIVFVGEAARIFYNESGKAEAPLTSTQGGYADLGYNVARLWKAENLKLIPFVRYSQYNPSGSVFADDAKSKIMGGISFMPIPNIAIKADYASEGRLDGTGDRTGYFNAGIGYDF